MARGTQDSDWRNEPVRLGWNNFRAAIAQRWAIHAGYGQESYKKIANRTGIPYSVLSGFNYGLGTAKLVHRKRGEGIIAGVHNRIYLEPLGRWYKDTSLTIPRLFGDRVFQPGVEYDLRKLVSEAVQDNEAKNIAIELSRPGDGAGVARVRHNGWQSYVNPKFGITAEHIRSREMESPAAIAKLEERLRLSDVAHTWVARDGDTIVGFCEVTKEESHNNVVSLYVLSDYRGQGIGSQLLETALAWLGDEKDIILGVTDYNNGAKRLYRRFGFKPGPLNEGLRSPFADGTPMPQRKMTRKGKGMEVQVRLATLVDRGALKALHDETTDIHSELQPTLYMPANSRGPVSDEFISRFIDKPDAITLVAVVEGRVVGMATGEIKRTSSDPCGRVPYDRLNDIVVTAAFCGQGIASRLIEHYLAWAEAQGVTDHRLEATVNNARAIKLYKRFGYRIVHVEMQLVRK